WVSFPEMVRLAGGEPRIVETRSQDGFQPRPEAIAAAFNDRTRAIIINSPNNPSGAILSAESLSAIAEAVRKHPKVVVVTDDIYSRIVHAPARWVNYLRIAPDLSEQTVMVSGVSKTYAMTGWRIGLALAPTEVARAMAALQSHTTSGANHPAQYAAAVAFSDERVEAEVKNMVQQFHRRREIVVEYFREHLPGFEFVEPLGAFYLFFRVDACFGGEINDAVTFCQRLIADGGVALVPGEAFGDDRWVRLSFAASEQQIRKALKRLVLFINNLRGVKSSEREAGVARQ
ncbi:MAG: aminotransferase class I/II-fold pyridoxal phosphate-dependent enzyme, partial [Gemmatimonadetes bacterium]|nr:aminotransferase class I/II-fold pyridoxal phosphate-dependent enzyme [Gemmatimonadota bacterium]